MDVILRRLKSDKKIMEYGEILITLTIVEYKVQI